MQDQTTCPYCEAVLGGGVLSCRCCGRDLTPVLPLLRRIEALECRLVEVEKAAEESRKAPIAPFFSAPQAPLAAAEPHHREHKHGLIHRRRYHVLPLGLLALLGSYASVVLWLDLPLSVLRSASVGIPFVTGLAYFGIRPRLTRFDAAVAAGFAIFSVASMNGLLGWIDNIPLLPQGPAAWRETLFYALSIGASMLTGMLLRVTQAALTARGIVSLPALREVLLAVNGKMPVDTIKNIEKAVLMATTVVSAIAGLIAVLLGVK